jgi:hypothetical protein
MNQRRLDLMLATLGLGSLAAVLAMPFRLNAEERGEALTRHTVRLALVYYAAALTLMLLLRPGQWDAVSPRARLARWCWTWGWISYLVHVACAFHFYHHWSHNDAVRHTALVSGFGSGIYVSHLFTLLWGSDVVAWWFAPLWYARRSSWFDRSLHAAMLFVVFNATIVYETGVVRWAGVVLFAELAGVYLYRRQFNGAKAVQAAREPAAQ